MAYRSKYNRRLRAVQRLQKRLAVAALLGATACAAGFLLLREPVTMAAGQSRSAEATPARPALQAVAAPGAHAGARRVYPFSVVPGGLSGRIELLHAVRTDQVVAQHYAGLQVEKVDVVKLSKPRAVYVSYRKGDKVYWTSKKVMLAEGETLLSDGDSQIRTRCGNRISDVPRLPVAADEPSAEVLDTAMSMDEDGDGQRQADAAPQNVGADGLPAAGQPVYLSSTTYGSAPAPATPGVPASLALLGSAGAAPGTPNLRSPVTMGGQIGTPATSSTSTGSGKGGTSGAPATGIVTDSGGDTGTPSATVPVLGPGGDHSTAGPTPGIPPVPELTNPGTLPVIHPQSPVKPNEVPEPGSLWLSGAGLALVLLRRRKPRRSRR